LPRFGGRFWSPEWLKILNPDVPVTVITYDAQTYTLSNPFEAQAVAALALPYRRILEKDEASLTDDEFWGSVSALLPLTERPAT
jgi:hypothetical protein